jgi:hypothetical protein
VTFIKIRSHRRKFSNSDSVEQKNKINSVSASGTIHDGPLSPYLFYITLYTTSHHTVRSFRKNCNKSISTRSLSIELSNRLETDAVETSPLFRVNILTNTGFQRRIYSSGALPAWNWKSSLYSWYNYRSCNDKMHFLFESIGNIVSRSCHYFRDK